MKIIYSPKFARSYRRLPEKVKKLAEIKEGIFRKDPFHPGLKTHKLGGKLRGLFSFSIDQKYRIIFEISKDQEAVYFHTAGDHSVYK